MSTTCVVELSNDSRLPGVGWMDGGYLVADLDPIPSHQGKWGEISHGVEYVNLKVLQSSEATTTVLLTW